MKYITKFSTVIVLLALMLGSVPVHPAQAAAINVTSTADTLTPGTLRYAVANAAPGDTIEFDLIYPAIIALTGNIEIATALTISGPGEENLTIDANGVGNAFTISTTQDITITDLTITNGVSTDGGGIYKSQTSGTLSLTRVTFNSNSASNDGGAIYSNGPILAAESTFSGNTAGGDGGAIMAFDRADLTVTNSSFTNNTATGNGGALYFSAKSLNISQSTFNNNLAANGGAISKAEANNATIANSTFTSNSATTLGGAVYNSLDSVNLRNNTLSDNSAVSGGGIYSSFRFMLFNNIIANSSSGNDCFNAGVNQIGNTNLIETGNCTAEFTADPMLGALQDNGGLTASMAIPYDSPAIDVGDNNICANAPVSNLDQRGEPRPQDGNRDDVDTCDLGAYEAVDPRETPTISVTNSPVSYNGSAQAASISGSTAGTVSNVLYDGFSTVPAAVGTYAITADFLPDDTYTYRSLTAVSAGDFVIEPEYVAPTVDSFTAASPASTYSISITDFTASDNVAVSGYLITSSSTPPAFDAAGWSGTAPAVYTVTANGSYSLYPWAKDASGNVSAVFGAPAAVTVDNPPPFVSSITRTDSNPSGASSVDFTVTFSEPVSGVDLTDFDLTTTGAISGESASGLSGSGDSFTVTVDTGSGDGTIRLDVLDDDSITDIDGLPLDGGFISGEVYDIDKTAPETSLDVYPADPSDVSSPSFEFSSPDGTAVFECQLDSGGFSACTSPHSYSGLNNGTYIFDVRAVDLVGNADGSPASYTWDVLLTPPNVSSVVRAESSPTNASSVNFTVTFSDPVTGVDTADFSLTTTGAVAGESVTGVSGSGGSYTVTVATGSGDGTIRLDVLDDDSIIDVDSLPLDGGFITGEVYEIDNTAPETSLDVYPGDPSTESSPSFEFSSLDATAVFECQLDSGGFSACTSPHGCTGLSDGAHTFEVRAVDPAGNTDSSPASYTWNIALTAPSVSSVVRADSNPTNSSSVNFTVTFSNSVTGVDAADFSLIITGAVSGESVTGVSGSGDTYTVTAATGSGDGTIRLDVLDDDSIVDANSLPLEGGFTSGEVYDIDKTSPETSLDAYPANPSADPSPSFAFSSLDGSATFECQLDSGGFSDCSSPFSLAGLSSGEHTFEVRAVDLLGNLDPTPASYTWTKGGNIFWDDFETNDLSRWTRFNDGGGFLNACNQAALNGSYGACVERGDNDKRKQLIDDTPLNETTFNARFNFDINSLSMTTGERFRFMQFKMDAERPAFIVLKYDAGVYSIQLNTLLDDLTKAKNAWIVLPDAVTTIEVEWQQSSAPGANDGFARLFLDDLLQDELAGLDNDTISVTSFRMGFTSKLAGKSISGIFYIDDVATSSGGHIGLP